MNTGDYALLQGSPESMSRNRKPIRHRLFGGL